MRFLGIDIGGTKCALVIGDESGHILRKEKFPTTEVNETLDRIYAAAEAMRPFDAIGISCGGPLDTERGIIQSPPNLFGWDDIHIADELRSRFGVPVRLCNDADACALAEWRFGAGRGTRNMIFLTFGTGMGAGLILNGQLYSGSCGMAGEVGHIRLEQDGPVGYGKKGSFEGFCSGGGLARLGQEMYRKYYECGGKSRFIRKEDIDTVTAKELADAARGGDRVARMVFCESAEKLGRALSLLIDILNPEMIVIGSIFERCEPLFRETMERVIGTETLTLNRHACRIVPAQLGDMIGDAAALSVAFSCLKK